MRRPEHYPLALFSLVSKNERAKAVLAHQCNKHLVSYLEDGTLALDIGHVRSKSGDTTLATLGRGDTDVFVEGSGIAKVQCSFELNLDTKVVMFYDRSHSQSSQVFGLNAMPFESIRPRKVVVQNNVNAIIDMGGEGRNLVQLELKWHYSTTKAMEMIQDRENITFGYEQNPRLARTIDEADTVVPSRRETRPYTAGLEQSRLRYATIVELGSGQFGKVFKAVDVDSGRLMAVKILKRPPGTLEQEWRVSLCSTLKHEVDILSGLSHPHIVDYITSRGWNEGEVEIFMGLKEGTLQSLVEDGCPTPIIDLGQTVIYHMLQAIDFLAVKGIVHRDVKPENILYTFRQGQYHFQLGDFGLSNRQAIAATFAGSLLYMAPEMFQSGKQTHKADIWSLYVTMLWTMNVEGFRDASKSFKTLSDAQTAVLSVASKTKSIAAIQEMARINPEERASAAQMLVKCFNGQGLTTLRNQVFPLVGPEKADSRASAYPAPRYEEQRGIRKNVNLPTAANRFCVEKARSPQAQPRRPRQPAGPTAEKRPRQIGTRTSIGRRIPGAFPVNGIDTSPEARRRIRFT